MCPFSHAVYCVSILSKTKWLGEKYLHTVLNINNTTSLSTKSYQKSVDPRRSYSVLRQRRFLRHCVVRLMSDSYWYLLHG